jgi:hypothetical protein
VNDEKDIVTRYSFDHSQKIAGFPFDEQILAGIDRFSSRNQFKFEKLFSTLSKEDYNVAKKSYLENILSYDVRFVDPVTNSKFDLSKDCISLNLQIFKNWKDISNVRIGFIFIHRILLTRNMMLWSIFCLWKVLGSFY